MTPAGSHGRASNPGQRRSRSAPAGATITGKVYRYVSWRDEDCPLSLCEGGENTKRVTVAITIDVTSSGRPAAPRVGLDDRRRSRDGPAGLAGTAPGGPGGGDPITAQSFYLYDTPCGHSSRQPQSGSHADSRHGVHRCRGRGQLDLRESGHGQAARPDGKLGDAGRHQHARLRVFSRRHRQLSRRPGDAGRGLRLRSNPIPRPMPRTPRDPASGACMRGAPGRCRRSSISTARSRSRCSPRPWGAHPERAPVRNPGRPHACRKAFPRTACSGCHRLRPRLLADDPAARDLLVPARPGRGSAGRPPARAGSARTWRHDSERSAFLYDHPLYPSLLEVATSTPL